MTDSLNPTDREDSPPRVDVAATLTVTLRLTAREPSCRLVPACDPSPPCPDGDDSPPPTVDAAGRAAYDLGFADGAAAGAALGRRVEALRWADEVERWRRLVRWTAAQRETE